MSNDSAQNGNGNGAGANGNDNGSASGTGTTGSSTAGFSSRDLRHIHAVSHRCRAISNNSRWGSVREGIAQGKPDHAARATTGSNAGTTSSITPTNRHSATNGGATNGATCNIKLSMLNSSHYSQMLFILIGAMSTAAFETSV